MKTRKGSRSCTARIRNTALTVIYRVLAGQTSGVKPHNNTRKNVITYQHTSAKIQFSRFNPTACSSQSIKFAPVWTLKTPVYSTASEQEGTLHQRISDACQNTHDRPGSFGKVRQSMIRPVYKCIDLGGRYLDHFCCRELWLHKQQKLNSYYNWNVYCKYMSAVRKVLQS